MFSCVNFRFIQCCSPGSGQAGLAPTKLQGYIRVVSRAPLGLERQGEARGVCNAVFWTLGYALGQLQMRRVMT